MPNRFGFRMSVCFTNQWKCEIGKKILRDWASEWVSKMHYHNSRRLKKNKIQTCLNWILACFFSSSYFQFLFLVFFHLIFPFLLSNIFVYIFYFPFYRISISELNMVSVVVRCQNSLMAFLTLRVPKILNIQQQQLLLLLLLLLLLYYCGMSMYIMCIQCSLMCWACVRLNEYDYFCSLFTSS